MPSEKAYTIRTSIIGSRQRLRSSLTPRRRILAICRISALLLLEERDGQREQYRHRDGQCQKRLPQIAKAQPLGEDTAADGDEMGGREDAADKRSDALQRRDRVDQPRKLHCRQDGADRGGERPEEHTSELQSLMRISYAVFCLKKKNNKSK